MRKIGSGRYPAWARTKEQQAFVMKARIAGNRVTQQDFIDATNMPTAKKRGPGRPKGSKNKSKRIAFDHIVVDTSGSMYRYVDGTKESVDEYMSNLRDVSKKTKVKTDTSLTYFSSDIRPGYVGISVEQTTTCSRKELASGGGTVLYRAIYRSIKDTKSTLATRNIKNADVTITIFTDGEDIGSWNYLGDAKKAIQEAKELGWTVAFVGAGRKSHVEDTAKSLGIDVSNVLSYDDSAEGRRNSMRKMSQARVTKTENLSRGITSQMGYFSLD
jgi:Mg-chelatase subunit ChlD